MVRLLVLWCLTSSEQHYTDWWFLHGSSKAAQVQKKSLHLEIVRRSDCKDRVWLASRWLIHARAGAVGYGAGQPGRVAALYPVADQRFSLLSVE